MERLLVSAIKISEIILESSQWSNRSCNKYSKFFEIYGLALMIVLFFAWRAVKRQCAGNAVERLLVSAIKISEIILESSQWNNRSCNKYSKFFEIYGPKGKVKHTYVVFTQEIQIICLMEPFLL